MGASAAPRPERGHQEFCQCRTRTRQEPDRTENTMISMMPSQKMGAAWPATATTVQSIHPRVAAERGNRAERQRDHQRDGRGRPG